MIGYKINTCRTCEIWQVIFFKSSHSLSCQVSACIEHKPKQKESVTLSIKPRPLSKGDELFPLQTQNWEKTTPLFPVAKTQRERESLVFGQTEQEMLFLKFSAPLGTEANYPKKRRCLRGEAPSWLLKVVKNEEYREFKTYLCVFMASCWHVHLTYFNDCELSLCSTVIWL